MNNCKKCGALIYGDFLYCGKCGEPVNNIPDKNNIINLKKPKKFKSFENKIQKTFSLNVIFAAIWFAVSSLSLFLLYKVISAVRIASANISSILYQLSLKYEYVREGLSISYVSSELKDISRYCLNWIYIAGLVILICASVFFVITHIYRCVLIKKNAPRPVSLNKIQTTVSSTLKIVLIIFIIVIAVMNLFMLII